MKIGTAIFLTACVLGVVGIAIAMLATGNTQYLDELFSFVVIVALFFFFFR